ncbi:MAG: hypothetical protein GTN76_05065, partial [Candidatus Aenigmarchaeota archaeon]|nr:hypothetical protein [Candidatus Aenigmarchaeota archaeon]
MKSIYSIVSRIFLSAVAILFTYHLALGASPLSNQDAMRLIEESARKDFVYVIPEGEIEIYSVEVEVSVSKQKLPQKKHSYPAQYLNLLGAYAKCGLIEIKEIKEDKSLLKKVLALGTKKYLVTITEKGKKAAVDKSPDGDYILRMGEVKMASIDKNYQFEPPVKDQYDYVYVLGKYKVFPTEIGKEFFYVVREPLQDIYRIKAIFRKDSLQDQYEFVVYDWGFI